MWVGESSRQLMRNEDIFVETEEVLVEVHLKPR